LADYFRVLSATVPTELSAGQLVLLQPRQFFVLLSGRARDIETAGGAVSLQVSGGDQRYLVRVDPQAAGARTSTATTLEDGDTVAVFGELLENATVRAAVVDVVSGAQWSNWYFTDLDSNVWLYSAFHKHLLSTPNQAPELEGQSVVARGRWHAGNGATLFDWAEENLFVFQEEEGAYASWLPTEGRQPLAASLEPAMTATPEEPSGREETPTPEPRIAENILGEISEQGVFVRVLPSTDNTPLSTLTLGTEVFVQCQTAGEIIQGTGVWYLVTHSGDQEGYVFAPLVRVTSDFVPGEIPICPSE
jgi:hypothetical protein